MRLTCTCVLVIFAGREASLPLCLLINSWSHQEISSWKSILLSIFTSAEFWEVFIFEEGKETQNCIQNLTVAKHSTPELHPQSSLPFEKDLPTLPRLVFYFRSLRLHLPHSCSYKPAPSQVFLIFYNKIIKKKLPWTYSQFKNRPYSHFPVPNEIQVSPNRLIPTNLKIPNTEKTRLTVKQKNQSNTESKTFNFSYLINSHPDMQHRPALRKGLRWTKLLRKPRTAAGTSNSSIRRLRQADCGEFQAGDSQCELYNEPHLKTIKSKQ